ncbi:hypothetical protein ACJJTC_012129 [Scirpophaga incertulas]
MHVKVPEVKRCCCCIPLRYGIVVFGVINIILSLLAVAYLVVATELDKATLTEDSSLEEVTTTVLYSILGMGVLLNVILLIAGCQRDISMLRVYILYALLTTLAALVPLFILLSRKRYEDVFTASLAIVMQVYVIVLVRSEIIKLEKKLIIIEDSTSDVVVVVSDTDNLI